MPHTNRAVLQIAIVESKTRIDEDFFHAALPRQLDLAREVLLHDLNRIARKVEIRDLAHVLTLNIADDYSSAMARSHFEDFRRTSASSKIDDIRACFQTGTANGWIISLD